MFFISSYIQLIRIEYIMVHFVVLLEISVSWEELLTNYFDGFLKDYYL